MVERSVGDSLKLAAKALAEASESQERDLILILISDALDEIANAQSCLLTGKVGT